MTKEDLKKLSPWLYEISQSFREDMRVPARIYVDEKMLEQIFRDRSLEQLVNITTLQGIVKYALAMPDIHEGYGFPIGGVAATKLPDGVISPGGVGYDISCGVRLLASNLFHDQIKPHLVDLTNQVQRDVPSGVGRGGRIKLDEVAMDRVLEQGAKRVVEQGYGKKEDLERCEESGSMGKAKAAFVSQRAKTRGKDQLGTLGAGNHFLEIQRVDQIYEPAVAQIFGLKENQITFSIHCGSRGLGHQVCTDYVKIMLSALPRYKIRLPDRELAYAPFSSPEGERYFGAMAASANFAWANRQVITHLVRQAWQRVLTGKLKDIELNLVYDVAHNIAKIEKHRVNGQEIELCLHRKGATRAFPAGHPELPEVYQKTGQPVLIPGTMGTSSYVLVGTEEGMKSAFGTVCHGAGRRMSRHQAKREIRGSELRKELEEKGIIIRAGSVAGLAEEAPLAYKDVDRVVEIVHQAGLAKKVAKLKPLAVIKG